MAGRDGGFKRFLQPFGMGSAFGIPLRLHPATLLVWGLAAWSGFAFEGVVLFGSVLLHEGAHAWMARSRGLDVHEVVLLPFGGAARMELGVWAPADERTVALAGPLLNIGLAATAWALSKGPAWVPELLGWASMANLMLAAFNLLPLLPLDGGRVLRSLLVEFAGMGVHETTRKLSRISRRLTFVLGFVGVLGMWDGTLNVSWVVVAIFLYRAAGREEEAATVALLRRAARPARRVRGDGVRAIRAFAVSPDTSLRAAVHLLRRGGAVILVVDEDGLVLGTLLEGDVWDGAAQFGLETPVVGLLGD